MYLSRLILNPHSRQVQRELANPYQMHRTIMSAFPENLPQDERVLFRLEQDSRTSMLILLVQSQHEPDWSAQIAPEKSYLQSGGIADGLPNPAVKQVSLRLSPGQRVAFRLHANPTAKRTFDKDGKKEKKRIGLYREEDQLAWLTRKLDEAGCHLISARTGNQEQITGALHRDSEKHRLQFLAVRFDGVLEITDPQRLLEAVNNGIGSGKGLGFGLLSLAPVR